MPTGDAGLTYPLTPKQLLKTQLQLGGGGGVCDKHRVALLCYLISCLYSVTCVWNRFSHHQNTQKWEIRDRE